MTFLTDNQTLTDLNLAGKYKTGSAFNLFNRVKTRGGELLLEEMFKSPLSSVHAINLRSSRLKYFQEVNVELTIDAKLTEMAALYLKETGPGSRLSATLYCYKGKAEEILYRSEKLDEHRLYIGAVQHVLLSAGQLFNQLAEKDKAENPCRQLQIEFGKIVDDHILKQIDEKYLHSLQETAKWRYFILNKYRKMLQELLDMIYEFDLYISVSAVARDRGFKYAQAENGDGPMLIEAKNLRHPTLSNATGNSITLNSEKNLFFLTGANMAGKSTWMKTLGVSFYLAHMGFPVAADSLKFSAMEGIFTSINVPDDIGLGWSHFYAEVMRIKQVAKEISNGRRLFVLFDELFKGTNVKDAYDATLVVTQKLAKYRCCAFVVSTHIIEVGESLSGISNIQFYYMPTVMNGSLPQYTYQLVPGITHDRQGMIILENEKILELLD